MTKKTYTILFGAMCLIWLALLVGVICVVWHFVSKAW